MQFGHILEASPAIQLHLVAAIMALILGIVMWLQAKGTRAHKIIGRGFIYLMIITAISAIFIRQANDGSFSLIHIFVPITLIAAWQSVTRIKQKNIEGHKKAVKGLFFGALLIPGIFAFLPGRILYMSLFG